MFKRLSHTYKAILLVLLAYVGFSVSDASVKYLTPHYSIYQIITVDLFLAALLLLSFAPKLGGVRSLYDRKNAKIHLFRGFMNFLGSLLVVYLFSILPLTTVYTVGFLSPFMITLIAIPLYKETVGWHRWLAMVVGFSGILIAFRPWENTVEPMTFLFLLLMPLCFSLMHGVVRSLKDVSDLSMSFYPIAISCLLTLPFMLGDFHAFALNHIPFLLISGVGISMGLLGVSKAYHMADASLIAPLGYTQMIWGLIFGALFFGDFPDGWMIAGAGIIIASGIYLVHREHVIGKTITPAV